MCACVCDVNYVRDMCVMSVCNASMCMHRCAEIA